MTKTPSSQVLIDLIQRTKNAVREFDNLNYRKMKKILMIDTCESESQIGDGEDTPDEQTGGDSSKSNSIQSVGVSASSQSSSTNSMQLPNADPNDYSSGSVRNRHKLSGVTANLIEHGANNFATIRTTSIVTKQHKEHMQEEMHEQMSGYKRMRREHQGALVRIIDNSKTFAKIIKLKISVRFLSTNSIFC